MRIHIIYMNIPLYIYMVFTTEEFFEVVIENWPKWYLNPRPLNSVETLQRTELSGHEFNSDSEPTLQNYSNFIVCLVSHFIWVIAFVSRHVFVLIEIFWRQSHDCSGMSCIVTEMGHKSLVSCAVLCLVNNDSFYYQFSFIVV